MLVKLLRRMPMELEHGVIKNTGWRFTLFGERASNDDDSVLGRLLCLVGLHRRELLIGWFGPAPLRRGGCLRGCGSPGHVLKRR
jgi:hypothetical protein